MAISIGNACIFCGACAEECPSGAIAESTEIYEADSQKCFECVGISGVPLCEQVCPVGAIEVPPLKASLEEMPAANHCQDVSESDAEQPPPRKAGKAFPSGQLEREAELLELAGELLPGHSFPSQGDLTEANSRFRRSAPPVEG